MEQMERLEAFERMMADVSGQHAQTVEKMQALKAQGKERSATYRQLMGEKLQLARILGLYRLYGLTEE